MINYEIEIIDENGQNDLENYPRAYFGSLEEAEEVIRNMPEIFEYYSKVRIVKNVVEKEVVKEWNSSNLN